jgi:hypothetical protein
VIVQAPNVGNAKETEQDLPVICVVGSNYYQMKRKNPCPTNLKHYLSTRDSVIDQDLHRHMRNPMDLSLAAYKRNASAWHMPVKNKELPPGCTAYTSNSAISAEVFNKSHGICVRDDYILIIANFSPFITITAWGEMSPAQRDALLNAWPLALHLDPLVELIQRRVDLWVGHGKTLVWNPFWSWREQKGLTPWMLTYNLSRRGIGSIDVAGAKPQNAEYPRYC